MHKITAIPKSGDPSHITNYRPISLLCILSKVMESIVYDKVIDFLRPHLSTIQFGFLSKRCSTQQLLTCYHKVVEGFEKGLSMNVLYLDLRKAFDSVPHQELLFKLWRMGITGNLWKWFRAYLDGRLHFTLYNGSSSPILHVQSGVPQGSALLFLVYINDISSYINHTSAFFFADDGKILKTLTSSLDSVLLQDDLNIVGT